MCGIFCSISRDGFVVPDDKTKQFLCNRGPDSIGQYQTVTESRLEGQQDSSKKVHATFVSTVLSLRGLAVVEQPLRDDQSSSVLCWNGEAWVVDGKRVHGNDSSVVFRRLLEASQSNESLESRQNATMTVLSCIQGPYALVFYDATNGILFFGRDPLGRRSLLHKATSHHDFILSSVCHCAEGDAWTEVETEGIYMIDLNTFSLEGRVKISCLALPSVGSTNSGFGSHVSSSESSRISLPESLSTMQNAVRPLYTALQESLKVRVQHVREAVQPPSPRDDSRPAKVAVLFSGGLDCTILAQLCHDLLPLEESIDLLNVAFENPRIHKHLEVGTSPYEICPDRITGRSSYAELSRVCPNRHWRFVEINVPYNETQTQRQKVMALMYPHATEMDLSISYALYFASQGSGFVLPAPHDQLRQYTTTAHVLLSGLGADELFGGYQRHSTAFARRGYSGLVEELNLDFGRIGKRNLGRDDRVISDSGREVRFPYLDEEFVSFALRLPVEAKCDFGNPQIEDSEDPIRALEPAKRILRLLAWQLGMKSAATEKKRAIQFGARTAKMETSKTKGTHVLI